MSPPIPPYVHVFLAFYGLSPILVNESKEEYRLWNGTALSSNESMVAATFGKSSHLTEQPWSYLRPGTLRPALY